jgi:hypothetical protein
VSVSRPSLFTPPERVTTNRIDRRMRGPQLILTFGEEINVLPPPRLESQNIQLIASSLPPRPLKFCTSSLYRAFHTLHSSDTARFDQPHSGWCRVQITKGPYYADLFTSSALGTDVLHSTQFSNTQLTLLHLTASKAVFGTSDSTRKQMSIVVYRNVNRTYLQHNFCDIWTFKSSGMLYDTISSGRYHVQGSREI